MAYTDVDKPADGQEFQVYFPSQTARALFVFHEVGSMACDRGFVDEVWLGLFVIGLQDSMSVESWGRRM